jgi:hypothetical protein
MAKRKRFIPFGLWPANWGLEGKRKQIALAEYHLDGEDLDRELLAIDHEGKDADDKDFLLGVARLDLKHGKITEREFRKQQATINDESFVEVVSADLRPSGAGTSFSFELDWNDKFVQELVAAGWGGFADEDVVNTWFEETCRGLFVQDLMEEGDDVPVTSANRTRRDPLSDDRAEYS